MSGRITPQIAELSVDLGLVDRCPVCHEITDAGLGKDGLARVLDEVSRRIEQGDIDLRRYGCTSAELADLLEQVQVESPVLCLCEELG